MKIDRLEFFCIDIPLPVPFRPSWAPGYTAQYNHYTLLRITTDTGIKGLTTGMCAREEHSGLGEVIVAYLLGVNPTDIAQIHQRLDEASWSGWRNFWIKAACWDIKAKAEGQPVYKTLGGNQINEVPVYASTGEIHPPGQRAEEALQLAALGFKALKLRIKGPTVEDDIALVEAVRRVVGRKMDISIDANQARRRILDGGYEPLWTLERAIAFTHACKDLNVFWVEEPLNEYAYDELAELCRLSSVPIAGGELNAGWHEFKVMLEKGSYDIYQPDANWGGGVTDSIRVMEACRNRGLGYTPHTWSNGLGFLINLHLYATGTRQYSLEYPFDPPCWTPEVRDAILVEPIHFSPNGTVAVPQAPGFGILIDEDKLARYGRNFCDLKFQNIF